MQLLPTKQDLQKCTFQAWRDVLLYAQADAEQIQRRQGCTWAGLH